MELIATIDHHDPESDDKIGLYASDDGMIWSAAQGKKPYPTSVRADALLDAGPRGTWDTHIMDMLALDAMLTQIYPN